MSSKIFQVYRWPFEWLAVDQPSLVYNIFLKTEVFPLPMGWNKISRNIKLKILGAILDHRIALPENCCCSYRSD